MFNRMHINPRTEILAVVEVYTGLFLDPAGDVHEVGNEARDLALDYDSVAEDNVFLVHVGHVRLCHDCTITANNIQLYTLQINNP